MTRPNWCGPRRSGTIPRSTCRSIRAGAILSSTARTAGPRSPAQTSWRDARAPRAGRIRPRDRQRLSGRGGRPAMALPRSGHRRQASAARKGSRSPASRCSARRFLVEPGRSVARRCGRALGNCPAEQLRDGFQVSDDNPLVGLEGRAALLRDLGKVVAAAPEFSPPRTRRALAACSTSGRPGARPSDHHRCDR